MGAESDGWCAGGECCLLFGPGRDRLWALSPYTGRTDLRVSAQSGDGAVGTCEQPGRTANAAVTRPNRGQGDFRDNTDAFCVEDLYSGMTMRRGMAGGRLPLGAHNVYADPGFADDPAGDLHLQAGSPATGAGLALPGASTDYDGTPRPAAEPVTLGAFEGAAPPSE